MRAPRLIRLHLFVLCLCISLPTATPATAVAAHGTPKPKMSPQSRAIKLLSAQPRLDAGDGRDAVTGDLRLTFTPNNDHVHDSATITACAPAGRRLQLRGWVQRRYWWNDVITRPTRQLQRQPRRRPAGCKRSDRVYVLRWSGERAIGGRVRGDSVVLRVCAVIGARAVPAVPPNYRHCTARRVFAHATSVYGRITTSGSVAPGEELPFQYFADSRRPMVAAILPDEGGPITHAVGQPRLLSGRSSRASITVPPGIAPGRYRLALYASRGDAVLQMPIVVRNGSWALTQAPPAKTLLVVWPTFSWAAYERFDGNRDGAPDSWYYNNGEHQVVPLVPWYEGLKRGAQADLDATDRFTAWLSADPTRVHTSITDAELAKIDPALLAQYEAIWVAGHDEYYEQAAYDLLTNFRDGGGDLAFLSANNTARRVTVDPLANSITNLDYFEMKHAEYKLAGVGIRACGVRFEQGLAMSALFDATHPELGWLFTGTDIGVSTPVSRLGVEIDGLDANHSPAIVSVVATSGEVRGVADGLGCKRTTTAAAMTATRFTPGGGWVFASGNLSFLRTLDLGIATQQERDRTDRLLTNLWAHTVRDD